MRDINGEEFFVVDKLKVIKVRPGTTKFSVGDVVECVFNDGSRVCKFINLVNGRQGCFVNYFLQKL